MSAEGKTPGLSQSTLPREPLTQIELLITLDRMRRSIERIEKDLETAKANDKRFEAMEHDFRIAKWMATLAGGAAVLALATGIYSRFSWRTDPSPPPPSSSSDRLGSDRVAAPTAPPLQGH